MNIFVPGRLCLFGEHSDWAGLYNRTNSAVEPGMAIVTGLEQGIHAYAERCNVFRFRSLNLDGTHGDWLEWPLSVKALKKEAQSGGYFSYVTGVAAFMLEYYDVGGVSIDITQVTLPIKKGLSSSAAICVLVARAFNLLYDLQISTRGEMEAAYRGEIMTPSRCGRLDQVCAYGTKPMLMHFSSENIEVDRLSVGHDLHWVFADLHGEKNTRKILSALNACYPFAQDEIGENVQRALGAENRRIVEAVVDAMRRGDAPAIGQLMDESQAIFDRLVAPACPEELTAPRMHRVMSDPAVRALALGVKGVGSHGDGTIQMICANAQMQAQLCDHLNASGLSAYTLTIRAQRSIRKAIIPVAGYGTRMFPATKIIKKELLPVVDKDGIAKPALLILLGELEAAGIEEIALVINPDDQEDFDRLFKRDLAVDHYRKLPKELRAVNVQIQRLGQKVTYLYQREPRGFGHAVYQAKDFAGEDPVLMLLGDHIYSTDNPLNCAEQLMAAYEKTGQLTVALDEVDRCRVQHYGVITGAFVDSEERVLQATDMVEKPTAGYAAAYLGVKDKKGADRFYCVFGQYVLTPRVFERLGAEVARRSADEGEIELTGVLRDICCEEGMTGYRIDGRRFDIGIPKAYVETITGFARAGAAP
ncbi:MAG: NTP transferase domain-containing protein [Oscillospiraceae bacterium]|jgi:UTP-glucose-1-phosphate uridylyltransferase/galactokinase|nr:NTP transferase domain-containing protein [Oscillospiraceae bacterium]